MKILMVIPTFEPVVGGAERQLQGLAPELASLGHEITVVTRRLAGTAAAVKYSSGYTLLRLQTAGIRFGFHLALAWFLLTRGRQFDLIHCHTLSGPAQICSLLGELLCKPVLLKVTRSGQGSQIADLVASPFRRVVNAIWSLPRIRFAAITKDTLSELVSFGVDRSRCTVIPNGVQVPTTAVQTYQDRAEVIYTGRLIGRKRVDLLLEAFAGARESSASFLTVIGTGPLKDQLQSQASELGIASSVLFTGQLDHQVLASYLAKSDIFVLPSSSEGMSNSLLEAMAFGLVVIGANIEANSELVEHGRNGLLFDTPEELQSLLKGAIRDPELRRRLGQAARRTIAEGYSFPSIADRYASYYRELLELEAVPRC